MGFHVDFVVKRNGTRQAGVEISYRYNGSSRNLSSDQTDRNGEVRTRWDNTWEGREVEVFFDGGNKRKITLNPRDTHSVSLPGSCFPTDTPILTPLGERSIQSLSTGDLVMALDSRSGDLVACPVIQRFDHAPMRLRAVLMQDGRTLQVTDNHRLLTSNGYRFVADLVQGDRLISITPCPEGCLVHSVDRSSQIAPVHNLIVAGHFNFIAAGCVAHSFSRAPALQRIYWTARTALRHLSFGLAHRSLERVITPWRYRRTREGLHKSPPSVLA